jgi:hypothetical protein
MNDTLTSLITPRYSSPAAEGSGQRRTNNAFSGTRYPHYLLQTEVLPTWLDYITYRGRDARVVARAQLEQNNKSGWYGRHEMNIWRNTKVNKYFRFHVDLMHTARIYILKL